mgnify:CR=1 FL=1
MAENINNYFSRIGLSVNIDDTQTDPAARRALALEELKKNVIGTDSVSGNKTFVTESQAKHLYDNHYNQKRSTSSTVNKMREESAIKDVTRIRSDFHRTQGNVGASSMVGGASMGYSIGFSGHRRASQSALAGSAMFDTARAFSENSLNSLGIVTNQQRMQFKSSGMLGKAGALLGPGLGAATIFSTIADGGDMYETMTFNLAAASGMAGFTAGSRLGGSLFQGAQMVKNEHTGLNQLKGGKMRFAGGAVGGAIGFAAGAALVGGGMWAASDLTSNNSVLAKMAKGYSRLASNAGTEQNNRTLTMRQQALQQLSQSAINDRASLLGNEAAVLRGVL